MGKYKKFYDRVVSFLFFVWAGICIIITCSCIAGTVHIVSNLQKNNSIRIKKSLPLNIVKYYPIKGEPMLFKVLGGVEQTNTTYYFTYKKEVWSLPIIRCEVRKLLCVKK